MKPVDFKESTKVLTKPSQMSDSECGSLPVWSDTKQCISCWKMSFWERMACLFTGKVWLSVLSGTTQPPVAVSGVSFFARTPLLSHIKAFFANTKEDVQLFLERLANAAKSAKDRRLLVPGIVVGIIVAAIAVLLFNIIF